MGNLATPKSVQKLQTALDAKAEAEAGYRGRLPPQDDSAGVDGIGCTNLSGLFTERFALLALMGIRYFWPHKIIGRTGLVVHQAWKLRPLPASHQYSPRILSRPWVQSRSVLHVRELHTPPCDSARPRRYVPFYWRGLQLSD